MEHHAPLGRRASHRLLAAGLALLAALPATIAARPVDAATLIEAPVPPPVVHAAGGAGPRDHDPDLTETPEASTSIQYEQAMEHAGDPIVFEPGDRVTVPFTPRPDDPWKVDGRAPQPLPAGNATGRQLTDTPVGTIGQRAGARKQTERPQRTNESTIVPASYVTNGSPDDITTAAPVGPRGLRREVFGFLPYWELDDPSTTLDWRTLSTVAYFSVGCLSSGDLDKKTASGAPTTGWAGWTSSKMTSIINAAHQHQTRVVLTVSCFAWNGAGASRQAALLRSPTARSNLAKAAAAAVRGRGADGINLDFEPIVAGYADEYTALIRQVRSELNKVAPGYQLTFDAMGSIGNQPIAEATAPGGADAVLIMGYDYRTDAAPNAGSIDPLAGPGYDLGDTVKAYLAKVSPSKVILGVPYYGRAWSTSSDKPNATTVSGAKYGYPASPTYGEALDLVTAHGRRYDSVEQSPWTAYRKDTCTRTYGCVSAWRELYYDDAASLRLRYDLVNRTELRGVGIWALGYDGTRPELRDALAAKFLADRTAPVVGVATLSQTQRDEGFRVTWSSWDDSTIAGYDLQVSVDGAAWTAWLKRTTQLSAIYPGRDGHTYAFRIRAADVHGNVSAWRSVDLGSLGTPTGIKVGGFATVLADGLRMRAGPGTGQAVMATLARGDALQVIAGPVSRDGYTWWQVSGPVRQWSPVDLVQVGGWIAASGNGATNAVPRRPVYATRVDAGITGLLLANGGERVLTPNGDGRQDTLRIAWTNQLAFDSLALRVYRIDGTLAGTRSLGATDAGAHAYSWDGRLGGRLVPAGNYVIQLQGRRGGTTYSAPSVSPANWKWQFGVAVGSRPATMPVTFTPAATMTNAPTLTWRLVFGGAVGNLSAADFVRSGTATGCTVAPPAQGASGWTITVTGCSSGTVALALKARSIFDAVANWGPAGQASAPVVRIDRLRPTTSAPRVALRGGASVSADARAPLPAAISWTASDPGGAGVRTYEVTRSIDGGAFETLATGVTARSLPVSVTPGHTYRFAVRAIDNAGNVGAWVAGSTFRAYLPQDTYTSLGWSGAWATAADATASGGSTRSATTAGARVSYTFTGRAIGWVTTFGPTRGLAKVYIDGVLVATVDCVAATAIPRRVAFGKAWSSSGTHTIRVVVVGTSHRPRVDVDAFEVLR